MKDHSAPWFDHNRIRRSFRRGQATYHRHAVAQQEIARRLVAMLTEAGAPGRFDTAAEFGCGTGLLTGQLLDQFDIDYLTLNDLVPEAAPELAQIIQQANVTTEFAAGPIEAINLPDQLDLITSASTVQWVADIPALMTRLRHHLRPGGWLALSGFGHRQFQELRTLGSAAAAPSYVDADEWRDVLPVGLEVIAVAQAPVVLEFASAIELLRHLRETGVNGQADGRWSRSTLTEFEARYRARFGHNGQLPLTYDAVWVIARRQG